MPSARFNLRSTTEKDKETLIYLMFRYDDKRLKITTEETVMPKYWNFKEQKVREVKSYPKYIFVNDRLRKITNTIETTYRLLQNKGVEPTVNELKKEYIFQLTGINPRKAPEFWNEYEKFIESEVGRVVNDVIKDYNSLKKHLKGFEKHSKEPITFSSFNFAFYQEFVKYLTYDAVKPNKEKGLATNTVGKQIKNLKIFLNYCFKHEIIERFDLTDFKTLTEEVDKIYLTEDEIAAIYNYDLAKEPELEKYRDLFVVGCHTGLRYSDFSRIKLENIINDEIRITPGKSHKTVIIPMHTDVKAILSKHGNNLTEGVDSYTFNKTIKKVGELAGIDDLIILTKKQGPNKIEFKHPKFELISSHTCRRSFCTNQFLLGVPSILIMKISGHKTEKSFLRYIRIDEELAAKKMREYWK